MPYATICNDYILADQATKIPFLFDRTHQIRIRLPDLPSMAIGKDPNYSCKKGKTATSVMAVHRFAQLRRKSAGVDTTVLSTEKSAGE